MKRSITTFLKWFSVYIISWLPSIVLAEPSTNPSGDLAQEVRRYYGIAVDIGFPLGIVIIIYAGYLYITSTGNPETIGQAKQLLLGAISGLLVLLLAGLILGSGGLIESNI